MHPKCVTTNGILFLCQKVSRVFQLFYSLAKWMVRGASRSEWQHSWELYRMCWEAERRMPYRGYIVTGSGAGLAKSEFYPIRQWGLLSAGCLPQKAKHHTSSPFCGCGGTVSWRTPCPRAVEETRRKQWVCVCVYTELQNSSQPQNISTFLSQI